jgi:hypothetical protein
MDPGDKTSQPSRSFLHRDRRRDSDMRDSAPLQPVLQFPQLRGVGSERPLFDAGWLLSEIELSAVFQN